MANLASVQRIPARALPYNDFERQIFLAKFYSKIYNIFVVKLLAMPYICYELEILQEKFLGPCKIYENLSTLKNFRLYSISIQPLQWCINIRGITCLLLLILPLAAWNTRALQSTYPACTVCMDEVACSSLTMYTAVCASTTL